MSLTSGSTDFEELFPSTTVQTTPSSKPESARLRTNANIVESEAAQLIEAIRNLLPPKVKLTLPERVTEKDLYKENLLRNRISSASHQPKTSPTTGRLTITTDDPQALTAPSVSVKPLPVPALPKFDDLLQEVGLVKPNEKSDDLRFFTDCRILSEDLLKKLIMKRAEMLVVKREAKVIT